MPEKLAKRTPEKEIAPGQGMSDATFPDHKGVRHAAWTLTTAVKQILARARHRYRGAAGLGPSPSTAPARPPAQLPAPGSGAAWLHRPKRKRSRPARHSACAPPAPLERGGP